MSQDKDTREFEDYLKGESAISQQYRRESVEEPSGQLDEAILAASRKSVNSAPKMVRGPFSSHWQVPLSLAAVMILSVTAVILVQEQEDSVYIPGPIPAVEQEIVHYDVIVGDEQEADPMDSGLSSGIGVSAMMDKAADIPIANSPQPERSRATSGEQKLQRKITPEEDFISFESMSEPEAGAPAFAPEPAHNEIYSSDGASQIQSDPLMREESFGNRKTDGHYNRIPGKEDIDFAASMKREKKKREVAERAIPMDAMMSDESRVQFVREERLLTEIENLQKSGDRDKALFMLAEFIKGHPHYAIEELRNRFGSELLEEARSDL